VKVLKHKRGSYLTEFGGHKVDPELENFEKELMMEEQDELALALPRGCGHVVEKRCAHGCYIPDSDSIAIYCTACNPEHCGIICSPKRVIAPLVQERTLDTLEYFSQPLSERLAAAATMEDMTT